MKTNHKADLLLILVFAISCHCSAAEPAEQPSKGPFRLDSNEFPIGIYGADTGAAMVSVRKMGIEFVISYGTGRNSTSESIERDIKYLDSVHNSQMRAMFGVGSHWIGKEDGLDNMMKIVNAVKGHPAIAGWYLSDEPDGRNTPEQVQLFYDALNDQRQSFLLSATNKVTGH